MENKENTDATLSTELSEAFLSQREKARLLITDKIPLILVYVYLSSLVLVTSHML